MKIFHAPLKSLQVDYTIQMLYDELPRRACGEKGWRLCKVENKFLVSILSMTVILYHTCDTCLIPFWKIILRFLSQFGLYWKSDLTWYWLFSLGTLFTWFQKDLNYLAFQSFDCKCYWWRLFQKCVAHTKLYLLGACKPKALNRIAKIA
jgi:hypothetical protein